MRRRFVLGFVVLILILSACSAGGEAQSVNNPTDSQVQNNDAAASNDDQVEVAPTEVVPPTPTPEPTQPPVDQEEMKAKWKPAIGMESITLLVCQGTLELAEQLQAEEISSFEAGLTLMMQAALLSGVIEGYEAWTPDSDMSEIKDAIGSDLDGVRQVLVAWYNKEVSSAEVLPILSGPTGCESVEGNLAIIVNRAKEAGLSEETLLSIYTELEEALADSSDAEGEGDTATSEDGAVSVEITEEIWYQGSFDTFYFVGVVENVGSVPVDFVKVHVTFRDAEGILVDTDYTYTTLDVLLPGEVSPFTIMMMDKANFADDWTEYELRIEADEYTGGNAYKDFEVLSSTGKAGSFGVYDLVGEVKNTGTETADYVMVVALFYDAENNFVGADYTYTDFDEIEPDGTSPFTFFAMTDDLPGEIDHYVLIVEGNVK